jgi:hypothetical protein
MAIYHPALDSYHSAFRILQILRYEPAREYDWRALRILDFYAVFPNLIAHIRLPKKHIAWRKTFSNLNNPYWFSGEPELVFARMEPLQQTALDLLYAQGLIDPDKYKSEHVRVVVEELTKINLSSPSTLTEELLKFLVTVLGHVPFHGIGGLKDRTGLLEFRYDVA